MRKAITILLVVAILVAVLIPVGLEVNYRYAAKELHVSPLAVWWGGATGLVSAERATWHDETVLFTAGTALSDSYNGMIQAKLDMMDQPQGWDDLQRGSFVTTAGTAYVTKAQRYAALCIAETRKAQRDRFISEQSRVILEAAEQECADWRSDNYIRNTPPVIARWLSDSGALE